MVRDNVMVKVIGSLIVCVCLRGRLSVIIRLALQLKLWLVFIVRVSVRFAVCFDLGLGLIEYCLQSHALTAPLKCT